MITGLPHREAAPLLVRVSGPPVVDPAVDYAITDAQRRQIASFTAQAAKSIYQGQIRRLAAELGYGDLSKPITDPAVLNILNGWGQKVAASIQATYNQRLDAVIANDGDLNTFFAGVKAYNERTLIPFTQNSVQQQAVNDFFVNNGFTTAGTGGEDNPPALLWEVLPEDAVCNECQAAVNDSPMGQEDYDDTDMPNHQNCEHKAYPVDPEGGPDENNLWRG